jgi:aspartyl-tRNA(Asn)/glutamyl-tRNA(Gln) amidotransferase subunit C
LVQLVNMKLQLEDIEKLSQLARIEISEKEKSELLQELQSIVGYISEIEQVVSEKDILTYEHSNIVRADETTNTPGEYTQAILENAPKRNADYVQVDQVI